MQNELIFYKTKYFKNEVACVLLGTRKNIIILAPCIFIVNSKWGLIHDLHCSTIAMAIFWVLVTSREKRDFEILIGFGETYRMTHTLIKRSNKVQTFSFPRDVIENIEVSDHTTLQTS